MDYEKAYKESFEAAKGLHEAGNALTKMQMEIVFPQLAESEDERIRKWIHKYIAVRLDDAGEFIGEYREALAWLEKQKESLHVPETCKENADSFTDEDERIKKALIDGVRQIRCKNGITQEQMLAYLENQKEQKQVECIDFDNEFENQVSHLLASILNGEHEYNEGFVKYAAQSLLGYAKSEMKPDEWDKREKLFTKALQTANTQIGQLFEENRKLKEQKPIEWSEEDERMLARIIERGQSQIQMFETGLTPEQVSWLKSLRPVSKESLQSWKPNEEQMKWLKDVIETVPMTCRQQVPLESLYNDLKTLM